LAAHRQNVKKAGEAQRAAADCRTQVGMTLEPVGVTV
jgi:hypothetical protein